MNRKTRRLVSILWWDERAATSAMSLILVTTIVAIGATVGLVQVRNHIVQEFGDVAVGLDQLDQSFSYLIEIDTDSDGTPDETIPASFMDSPDLPTSTDPPNLPPAGIDLNVALPPPPNEG